jgi:hypothetical protein
MRSPCSLAVCVTVCVYQCIRASTSPLILEACGLIPLWSSGQSSWLQIQRSRVPFPALPDFLRSVGSGRGSTQLRVYNCVATST